MLKIIQMGMKADTEAAINALGKNEQVKKVFWSVFVGMAGARKKITIIINSFTTMPKHTVRLFSITQDIASPLIHF